MTSWSYTLAPEVSVAAEEAALPTSTTDAGEEHCLDHNTAHGAEAMALLLYQFQDSPRFKALIAIMARQIQEIEDSLWLELNQRDIEQSGGVYLDQIGKLIGQPRSGLLDVEYRSLLRARVQANRSKGTSSDIINVTQALFGNAGLLGEDYPAKVIYDTDGDVTLYDLDSVFQVLRDSVASGIQFMLIYQLSPTPLLFQFAPANVVVVDSTKGFANNSQTTGGHLRGARIV